MEFYSKILGTFNLNNIAIEIESPLAQYLYLLYFFPFICTYIFLIYDRYVMQIHNLPKKFKTKAVCSLAPIIEEVLARKRLYELSLGINKDEEEEEEGINKIVDLSNYKH